MRQVLTTASDIRQALDDVPSGSDISGIDSDSGDDETYVPRVMAESSSDDDDDVLQDDVRLLQAVVGGGGDNLEDELPDLDDVPAGPSAVQPAPAKRRRVVRERPVRNWVRQDLPPQEMPTSELKPKGLEDCTTDVQFFIKMFGMNNFDLLTKQSNLVRVMKTIDRNKPAPEITEKEIRQVIGIVMYMSVVTLPNIKLYWSAGLKNQMVSGVMTRDRFTFIMSCLHLSDNTLQPASTSPAFDRLYKVCNYPVAIAQ